MTPADPVAVAVIVAVASSLMGEPRSTLDLDLMIDCDAQSVRKLVARLKSEFYVDESEALRAVADESTFNAIHLSSSLKVDFFIAERAAFARHQLERGREVQYVSSDAKDTDFTVKVLDIDPEGRAFNLDESIQRMRYRDGYDKPLAWMEPGKVYKVTLQPLVTSNQFQPGGCGSRSPAATSRASTGISTPGATTTTRRRVSLPTTPCTIPDDIRHRSPSRW